MEKSISYKIWTVCMIKDGETVLMLNRQHDDFKGYIPPGGKVEFPESMTNAAIREVYEETGLVVRNLIYKGLYEYVNIENKDRYMIFNYLTSDFEGTLIEKPKEGELTWVPIEQLSKLPMQESIRRRIPYFFREGTFEIHVEWDNENNKEGNIKISLT
ncbi:8-oxo-dGTP diphosphatase [Bacillus salitolerans]|uniref:8-oxo-dGTP diphosphatase n=1 Tax=Bacillus salitolerans TaxID=1437434 RepID=A0ABW4LQ17_9BACI